MLQGKTKIELFETRPGGGYFKVEDSNMVTNACYNLVNLPGTISRLIGSPLMPSVLTPLRTTALQGLMLFDQNLAEDVNNIIPYAATMNKIGCASGSTNNATPYRGILNATETVDLENGRRFVWDFPTDKANGTIRSVCLTSPAGAVYGPEVGTYKTDEYTYGRFRLVNNRESFKEGSYSYSFYSSPILCSGESPFTFPIGSFEENTFLYLAPVTGGQTSCTFQKMIVDMSKLTLSSYKEVRKTQVTVTTKGAKLAAYMMADDNNIYSFYPTSTSAFDFVKIDAKTLEIIEEKNVNVQDVNYNISVQGLQGIEKDGYYYVCNGKGRGSGTDMTYAAATGIYKINITDFSDYTYIPVSTLGTDFSYYGVYMQNYSDTLSISSGNLCYHDLATHSYIINSDELKITYYFYRYSSISYAKRKEFILPSPWLPKPLVLLCSVDGGNDIYLGFDTCYMATINNLSTPVVKNETQTMKVTYEITEI